MKDGFLDVLQKAAIEDDKNDRVKVEDDKAFDVFKLGLNKYESFEEHSTKKGKGYSIPNYPLIEEHLEGLESGLYILAGESNSGKSAMMMNIVKDIACCEENNIFAIYMSLDDSSNELIPRVIAMDKQIPISVCSKPNRYKDAIAELEEGEQSQEVFTKIQEYNSWLEKRQDGIELLKSQVNKFLIEDSTTIKNSTDIENYIKKVKRYISAITGEKANLCVAVDALNDINLDKKIYGNLTREEKVAEAAKFLKQLTVDYDIPIFTSSHLRKLNGNRRPTVDDLRDSNTLLYEASVAWLVYNDVSKNKSGANIYWEDNNAENKLGAVIELDWAKNKKSSYKGRTFYYFKPYYSKAIEIDKDASKHFESLVYQQA